MPLSEFYRMGNGKIENTQQKATDISFLPDNEFVELVWENGQIMMQAQSNKSRKSPISSRFQFHTPKLRDKDMGNATTSKTGKFGAVESIFNDIDLSVPTGELGLGQDDDMVPWLNYPVGDNLQHDYCSELLPELSGVTVNDHPSNRNSYASIDKRECCNQTVRNSHNGVGLEQGNASNLSLSRAGELYPWSLQKGKASISSLGSGVSNLISSNAANNLCGDSVVGDFAHTKARNQDLGVPSSNPSLLNFSHFLRPAATAKANLQTMVDLAGSGSSGVEKMGDKDKRSVVASSSKSTLNDPNSGLQKEMGFYNQSNLASTKVDSIALVTNPVEESRPAEQSDAVCRLDGVKNDKSPNQALGASTSKGVLVLESEKMVEPVVASSSVCSANSAERVSNDLTNNLKRKCRDSEESECQSDDVDEELTGVKRASSARGGAGSKRSRAAEVHNLSERRRRDRINEKMRALQELIPNCNKVDKASMLDEAIEYLKTLQLQVQIMSMGAGLYMPHMMMPPGMQHIHAAHLPHFSPMGIGMGMGMGFGMGMVDMNGGSRGYPMYPVPPMQGPHFPSPPFPGPTTFQGVGGSNRQVFGHPGQVLPMTVSGSPLVPLSAQPPINSAMGLNASRMGVHLDVSNAAASLNSKDLRHNADASCSMNQTSSQFQATNEGFDQSALVQKNDQAPDAGGSAAVQSSNANDTVPSIAAGSD